MKLNIISEKIKMFKDNPKAISYWAFKFANLFKKNVLNNGERYDPNILGKFNINDHHQEARYHFAKELLSKNDTVIDIACGTGYGTALLADSCLAITGVDIARDSIEYADKYYKTKANINFVQSDLFSFNNIADVVVSFETVEHIHSSITDVVTKLLTLTKKKLICSVPYQEVVGNNKYHYHFNISESNFAFLQNDYAVKFLYQSSDGKIMAEKGSDVLALILVIEKNNF